MKYDLSIIVPIYNVEQYLEQTIQSLLKQKEYNYEIVLVNDGSTDNCLSICERYAKENGDRIRVVNKPNGGLPSARKAGVRAARGRYITFLDGDDWVDADYYYNMLVSAMENDAQVVCSSYTFSYPDRECIDLNAVETGVYTGKKLDEIRNRILYNEPYYTYGVCPSLCMKVILKNCLEEYIYKVPDNVTLAEDAACSFPIMFSCESMVVLKENTGYHYRQIGSSMMNVYNPKKINKVIAVMDYLEEVLSPYQEQYRNQIDMYYTQLIKELAKNELLSDASLAQKKETLNCLLQKDYVGRALADMKRFPLSYRLFFWMLRERKIGILNTVYVLYKQIRKR